MLIALWCLRVNSPQMWGLKYETKKKQKNKKQNFLIGLHQVGHLKYIKSSSSLIIHSCSSWLIMYVPRSNQYFSQLTAEQILVNKTGEFCVITTQHPLADKLEYSLNLFALGNILELQGEATT